MQQDACRSILQAARDLVAGQRVVTGENTVYRQDPDGQWWKMRLYQNGRGYFHLNVSTPRIEGIMYSVDAVERALRSNFGFVEDGVDADMPEAQMEDSFSSLATVQVNEELQILCAHRIQTAYHMHRMRRVHATILQLQHQISILTHIVEPQRATAARNAARSEETYARLRPNLAILPSTPLYILTVPTRPEVVNILTLMTEPTNLERLDVRAHAETLVGEWRANTVPHKCARAVLSGTPYPLLIGTLPLPSTPIFRWTESASTAELYVRGDTSLHDDHYNLLLSTFKDKFVQHVQHMMNVRTVRTYDFYTDRRLTQHVGSLIVSKFLARLRGTLIPVLHIESLASVHKGQGTGRRMFDFCKSLVLSDHCSYGLLLAQCLKIDFWQYRMNETTEGQAMIVQMQKMYDDVAFEPLCTMRTREVRDVDESAPSPAKQVV